MTQDHATSRRTGRFAGLTRTLLVVVTMAGLVSVPSMGAFASTRNHGGGGSDNGTGATAPQGGGLDVGLTPTWGLGFINSAVDKNALVNAMGRPFGASGLYAPLTGWTFPTDEAQRVADDGGLLYLNINSWQLVGDTKVCYSYKSVAAGAEDAMLQTWVDQLATFSYPNIILTFTHEPTAHNSSQPGCGTPAEYVAAYDHVWTYFHNHGATYPWVWTMVASSFTQGYAHNWQPPANEIDWVGVDGYNRFINGSWRSPEFIFRAADAYAAGIAKPLMIGEIGTMEDPADVNRKAVWLTDATNLFAGWGNVAAILWNDSQDYRPDSSTKTLNTWAALSTNDGAPFLSGTNGTPGENVSVWGTGFTAYEPVVVYLNSLAGTVLVTAAANVDGVVNEADFTIPTPLAGGDHSLIAVGQTSGMSPRSILDVFPPQENTFWTTAGDTWTYHGVGWVPGETVSVSFPGGTPVTQIVGANGSVDIPVVVPLEPNPGDKVTVTAPSFDLNVTYHVSGTISVPSTGTPQTSVNVSGNGYGASETVDVKFDGKATTQSFTTGAKGAFSGSLLLALTFGRHQVTLTGRTSGVSKNAMILLAPTMSLSPTSGPYLTVVTFDSGPGWIPGETVKLKIGSTVIQSPVATANGTVHGTFVIERHAAGSINIHLTGVTSGETASAPFHVTST
jgi:hypothetical protein